MGKKYIDYRFRCWFFVGARMKIGKLVLGGSAGDYLGSEMEGGSIEGKKNVGDYLASTFEGSRVGMRGGTYNN